MNETLWLKTNPKLASHHAKDLWRSGVKDWNAWVTKHKGYGIDFSHVEFEPNSTDIDGNPLIDFRRFVFPDGKINFFDAKFKGGLVSFQNAHFGTGEVDFSEVDFGSAGINFIGVVFQSEVIKFSHSSVRGGNSIFAEADFGDSRVDFTDFNFGNGCTDFADSRFGTGGGNFEHARFSGAEACFDRVSFDAGDANFSNVIFATKKVKFRFARFGGSALFLHVQATEICELFSFEGARFDQLFNFSHDKRMGCPLDLRRSKLSQDVVVNDIMCDFKRSDKPFGWPLGHRFSAEAADREDSQRFRRLKELAVSNHNHSKAIEFHIDEIRSRRGWETKPVKDLAQSLFWVLGDYGRSWVKPLSWLLILWLSFAFLLFDLRTQFGKPGWDGFLNALTYSGSNMLAFIPSSRTAKIQGEEMLFGDTVPNLILVIGAIESLMSLVLIFLFTLGVRNLFKM